MLIFFPDMSMMLQTEEEKVLRLCRNGHNVLITGQAGAGKTSLLKHVHATCVEQGLNGVVPASSGIATTQFDDGAMTLH